MKLHRKTYKAGHEAELVFRKGVFVKVTKILKPGTESILHPGTLHVEVVRSKASDYKAGNRFLSSAHVVRPVGARTMWAWGEI